MGNGAGNLLDEQARTHGGGGMTRTMIDARASTDEQAERFGLFSQVT